MQQDVFKSSDLSIQRLTARRAAADYLSVFGSQVERGPKVAIGGLGVGAVLQQHGGHLSVAAGTGYVELSEEQNKD